MSKEIDKLELLTELCKKWDVSFSGAESNAILDFAEKYAQSKPVSDKELLSASIRKLDRFDCGESYGSGIMEKQEDGHYVQWHEITRVITDSFEVKKELPTDERKQLVDFYLKTCNKTISIEYAGGIVDEYLQSETVEVKEENNLLKKYMMHVLAYESADYVTEINTDFNKLTEHVPVLFTIEEKDELSAISAESHKELGYT